MTTPHTQPRTEVTSKPISIVHIASGDLWAGAEQQLYHLLKALQMEVGASVSAIILNEGHLSESLKTLGIPLEIIPEGNLGFIDILKRTRRFIVSHKADIVHSHRTKENVISALVKLTLPHLRTVCTAHGAPEHSVGSRWNRRRIAYEAERLAGNLIHDKIIAVSNELSAYLAKKHPVDKLTTIENGIDVLEVTTASHEPITLPGKPLSRKIGIAGRLVPVKRIDLFIEIAKDLTTRTNDLYDFYIFGDGPLAARLKRQIGDSGLDETVHMMGFRSPLAPYLSRLDALMVTSDHEGLPLIVLESMAIGCPVIAHAVGGIPRALDDARAGFLIPNQDPSSYGDAVIHLFDDENTTGELTRRAKLRAEKFYSSTRCARDHLELYQNLMNTR